MPWAQEPYLIPYGKAGWEGARLFRGTEGQRQILGTIRNLGGVFFSLISVIFLVKCKPQPTPVFSSAESHGQKNLVGYSPQGCKVSDTTEPT